MKLELDLSPDDWDDYKAAPLGNLKRVGVVTPVEDLGIRQFVRLGVVADGKPVVVMTPWLIWQAAHRALAAHLGERTDEPTERPPVLDVVEEAMRQHEQRWGLDAGHPDGTDPEEWTATAEQSREAATEAATTARLTWAHAFVEATDQVMATDDPAELTAALARVAGCAANWIEAIKERA